MSKKEIAQAFKEIEEYCFDPCTFVDFEEPVLVDTSGMVNVPKMLWDSLKNLCLSSEVNEGKKNV